MRKLAVLALMSLKVPYAQEQPKLPSFEVFDIKPSAPGALPSKERLLPGGRIELPGATVQMMIRAAYSVREDMITGLPKWAETEHFDIIAKAPENTPVPTLLLMLRSLLADQFHLAMHNENQMRPALVLTRGKRPLKLQATAGAPRPLCSWTDAQAGLRRRECKDMTMADFARQLMATGGVGIEWPVIDETGIQGAYDFHFDVGFPVGGGDRPREESAAVAPPPDAGPTIFTALDEIGLKLESRKAPVSVVVVDQVERPATK
jgi:uncharacterized protein (TIGR03435 family)